MEYFDVLDEKRCSLGYTKERGSKLEESEYNQGIEIWIFNDNKLFRVMQFAICTRNHQRF